MRDMLALYTPTHDFAPWSGSPRKLYMIAASPRSGSTLLSTLLWRTGCLGAPLEYMNPRLVLNETRGEPSLNYRYWRKIIERRTTPNGTFGIKLFQRHMKEIAAQQPEILAELIPDFVIRLRRRDRIAHAVSYWRALKGQSWFYGLPENTLPDYNYCDVRDAETLINNQQQFWDRLLEGAGVNEISIYYEDFMDYPERTISELLEAIGESPARKQSVVALPLRQRDEFSDRVYDAYALDKAINVGAV